VTRRTWLALAGLLVAPLVVGVPGAASAQETETTEATALAGSADPEVLVGPPAGEALGGAALDARTGEVASLLRCPVCQGLSVEDSPATMAVNMKAEVREMLARGYTQDQILSYFERSYGEFVRLEPPLRGVNWLVWLAPMIALVLGGGLVVWVLRTRGAAQSGTAGEPAPPAPPARETLPEDPELAPYVLRVRELAYGWPGGTPPGEDG
jgi:cytochrome c-type biogenesis protein CcmH